VCGGVWVRADRLEIHLGVEEDFRPARKAHPGILVADLDRLAARLAERGVEVTWDDNFPGHGRFYAADNLGNRLEFLSPTVILAGRRPSGGPAGLVHRELRLGGGELTPPPPTPPTVVHLTAARLRELTERALRAAGAEQSAAATVARVLVDAERRGHPSHGVALPPRFHASVRLAGIRPG
jgi:hypothetical protein